MGRASVVIAPAEVPAGGERALVFLGGSIDMGSAPNWQADMIAALSDDDIVILNPRRKVWSNRSTLSANDPEFRKQVDWELAALEVADVIGLYLAPGSRSPISLLELGLYARSGKLVVHCAEGFWREGNVKITAARYGVELVHSMPALLASIKRRVWAQKQPLRTQSDERP